MYIRAISRAALLCSTILSFNAIAAGDRADYDLDDDGLIEINDLADLNEIRNHLDGAALYGDSTGCPEEGCNGFELTTDLDFDTNGDGQMNEQDTYWNDGQGWGPIGSSSSNAFTGDFHGNGHQIRNLYINRTSSTAGLFGYIEGTSTRPSTITKLAITGLMTSITGRYHAGALAARVNYAEIDRVFITGRIRSQAYTGGLAGTISDSTVSNVFSSAALLRGNYQGGLIGYLDDSELSNSIATGYVENGYGLLGYNYPNNSESLYWATDTSGQETSRGSNASYFGARLSELQCPTSSDNDTCAVTGTLFESWNSEVWNFGTSQQLPGLIMGDRVYRDSDGDGALDEDDAYSDTFAASMDTDSDGSPDRFTLGCDINCRINSGMIFDAFPSSDAAYLDADLDGLVDEWADGCDTACQISSSLTFDDFPSDRDNDGVSDAIDTDDNNDGVTNADADSDGLIDIASLEELNAVRFGLDGSGQVMVDEGLWDNSGCPIILWEGIAQQRCHGYELVADLDFDTNGDGKMNELDTYWNDGKGWIPISGGRGFSGHFNGNGHLIDNLYINQPGNAGLFREIAGNDHFPPRITKIAINGRVQVTYGVGGLLAAGINKAEIDRVFLTGSIEVNKSFRYSGGLAANITETRISNVFSSVAINDNVYRPNLGGGLIGESYSSNLSNSLTTGYVENGYGLLGIDTQNNYESLFWATDTSRQETSPGSNASYFGALLSELQCPTSPNNSTCTNNGTLYASWSSDVWDFGTGLQLPGLIMGDHVYRDSDGDGSRDESDAFPYNFSASMDLDSDGAADRWTTGCDAVCREQSGLTYDAFPASAAASQDADNDGLVDKWADGCDTICQTNSGLSYDDYPNDRDNDGITDAVDTDDNNDGIIDADADSDGLIDVASLEELNAIRFSLDGIGQRFDEYQGIDSTGCPGLIREGSMEQRCAGYELTSDLDFDTNSDGQINELDAYWNDGEGWEPIGSSDFGEFRAKFDGNGHQIRNLYVDRTGDAGLFGHVEGTKALPAEISRIAMTGFMTSVTGSNQAGVLAANVGYAKLNNIFVLGSVRTSKHAGGIAGAVYDSTVNNVFSSAAILAESKYDVGGLIGRLSDSNLSEGLSAGYVESDSGGGLLGYSVGSNNNNAFLYWATDASTRSNSAGSRSEYFGALLSELQCPTSPNNFTCTDKGTLYENWDSEVWDFGSDRQLPGLIMNGVVYRDSNGDGTLDVNLNAPSVALILTQAGREEAAILEGMGDVTIEVIISDEDTSDRHYVEWSSDDINLADSYEFGSSITFSSDGLVAGDYTISATVTDSGIPQLSDTAEMTIRVISDVDPAPAASSGGGGSGGGAMIWLLALLSAPLLMGRVRA